MRAGIVFDNHVAFGESGRRCGAEKMPMYFAWSALPL